MLSSSFQGLAVSGSGDSCLDPAGCSFLLLCVSFSAYPPRAVKRVSSKVLARQDLKTRADSQYQPAGRVSCACNPSIGEVETG